MIYKSNFKARLFCMVFLVFLVTASSFAQNVRTVTGTVSDDNGEALVGATVTTGRQGKGTVTDLDGKFVLEVDGQTAEVQVSYVGYKTRTVRIPAKGPLSVTLASDEQVLQEAVVIGYGVQRRSDLTGSVSSVGSKDFNQGVVSSPEALVNGKVSGVQIVNSGGSPSAGSTIRIRGGASLNASNDPLIVLDGMPMEVGGSVSGSGNFLSLINPNDIESMTILKDASSTAIYGSRASNGVIIITTKKGTSSVHPKITFSSTNALQTPTRTADMITRDELYRLVRTYGNDSQKSLLNDGVDTDWNREIFHTAFCTDNNLGVSGRVGIMPYRLSLGISDQNGILRTDNVTRYTGSLTLTPTLLDNRVRLNVNLKATYGDNRFANTEAIWSAATHNPCSPVYSGSDAFLGYHEAVDANGVPVTGATGNPAGLLSNYHSTSKVCRVIGSLDADYSFRFLPGLHAHLTLGYDGSRGRGHVYVPHDAYQYYNTGGRNYGYGPQKNRNRLFTFYFNYNRYVERIKSNFEVTAGYDYQFWKYTNAAYTELNDREPAEQQAASAADDQRHVLLSYYGRLNYSFDGRYLLTASLRRDGSSRFGKDSRWGSFPSVALGWRVSEEGFFKVLKPAFSTLKLRASYGVTGQQDGIANYSYLPLYTLSQRGAYYMFGGIPTATYRPSAYNSGLKWETTKAWNWGLDLGFFGDRLTGSIDYYRRRTEDLLATVPVAAGTNFNKQMLSNVGNITGEGVEMSLSATPVQTADWQWSLSGNATWQRNRITNLRLNARSASPHTPAGAIDSHYVQVLSEGHAPYSYYVYKQIYDERTGVPIEGLYADLNGDGKVDSKDLYHHHSPSADWLFGLSTSVRWKRLTLSTSLRASVGNYLYNGMAMNTGAWETMSYNSYQLNRLHASYLETHFRKRQFESDLYVENASFLKMDNLQLSYNFGKIAKWCSLNASFMVQNVFTLTDYAGVDPECQGGIDMSVYPRPRIYSLTIGLDF
ncbi:TonB-dependent receptor [Prevotella multiformis]|uniref:SusC/RagA family TonB-linked outer membrane protein n=1 Tax=Prevotella multiformis TaxID=282402 RepID=UPI001BAA77A2|nr:TonB-dependent receptor [Prevotella multiformis]QUB71500.1 TonB-dependent receptor [Prevotella multiformis]